MNACACSRPITDATNLCGDCTDRLRRTLAETPSWHTRLEITRTRQSKTGGRGIGVVSRNATRPLPWDERAARAGQRLHAELAGTVRVLVEVHPGRLPQNTVDSMSTWLLSRIEQWRRHEDAAELLDGLTDALEAVAAVCDRQPDRVYLGPCGWTDDDRQEPCPADVYAEAGQMLARCPLCDSGWSVDVRREWLLGKVEDQLVDIATLSSALSTLVEPVTTDQLRKMLARAAEHGRITVHPPVRGVAVWRVGDVVGLLSERRRAKQERYVSASVENLRQIEKGRQAG